MTGLRTTETRPFEAALNGRARRLELADGRRISLAVDRWRGLADQDDRWMVEHCSLGHRRIVVPLGGRRRRGPSGGGRGRGTARDQDL